jgi:hypothetical protein
VQDDLDRVNDLHIWDFTAVRREDGTLLILGSNDFTCYHYLEMEFSGVTDCDLPEEFSHAEFRLGSSDVDDDGVERWRVYVTAESMLVVRSDDYEIRAAGLTVKLGHVFYYDRKDLKPGQTIAPWVKRT